MTLTEQMNEYMEFLAEQHNQQVAAVGAQEPATTPDFVGAAKAPNGMGDFLRWSDTPTCCKCGSDNMMSHPWLCLDCRATGEPVYRQEKWDRRYLELAKFVSGWSKDPSTKTGAVIVDSDRRVVSLGYNGFAKGVDDSTELYADREQKYRRVVHCEVNAVLFADRYRLQGATLYTYPFISCSRCAVQMIQAGIKRCVGPVLPAHLEGRWGEDLKLTRQMFQEAGVELHEVEFEGVS